MLIIHLFHFLMLGFNFVSKYCLKADNIPHQGLPDTYDFDWVIMDLAIN